MKRKVIMVYSATGNSLFAAKQFPSEYEIMDVCTTDELPEDTDTLGFVFPVYYGGVPRPVEDFVRRVVKERDNSAIGYIFAVMTYGGAKGFATSAFSQLLGECGCALSYVNSVLMPDCYLPMVPKAPAVEERDRTVTEALSVLNTIIEEIKDEKFCLAKVGLAYRLFRSFGKKGRTPSTNPELHVKEDMCTGCGACVPLCPMQNIEITDGKAVHGNECISCCACYHFCPEEAVSFPKAEGHYRSLVPMEELQH